MNCQLCKQPVGSHWTSHPIIGAICSECSDKRDKEFITAINGMRAAVERQIQKDFVDIWNKWTLSQ